jgi:hypothetical protein
MPELANALAVRLFGTRRLALESGLWLVGIALLLGTLPSVVLFAAKELFLYVLFVGSLTTVGLLAFILPGLFIAFVGLWVGSCLVVLFVRGYLNLAIRCYNWLTLTYALAKEDVSLNARFARHEGVEATITAPIYLEIRRLRQQAASQNELLAAKERTIQLLLQQLPKP